MSPKILLIDDDYQVLTVIKEMIIKCIPYVQVELSSSGANGCKKAQTLMPDIIFLDIRLSGEDGLEICRKIRQNKITQHIHIIIMTGFTQYTKNDALDCGACLFLTKPIGVLELASSINTLLSYKKLQDDFDYYKEVYEYNGNLDRSMKTNIIQLKESRKQIEESISLSLNLLEINKKV